MIDSAILAVLLSFSETNGPGCEFETIVLCQNVHFDVQIHIKTFLVIISINLT